MSNVSAATLSNACYWVRQAYRTVYDLHDSVRRSTSSAITNELRTIVTNIQELAQILAPNKDRYHFCFTRFTTRSSVTLYARESLDNLSRLASERTEIAPQDCAVIQRAAQAIIKQCR